MKNLAGEAVSTFAEQQMFDRIERRKEQEKALAAENDRIVAEMKDPALAAAFRGARRALGREPKLVHTDPHAPMGAEIIIFEERSSITFARSQDGIEILVLAEERLGSSTLIAEQAIDLGEPITIEEIESIAWSVTEQAKQWIR